MAVDENSEEEKVPVTATHLKVIPGPNSRETELESLFRDHSDRVFRAAYRITGNTVDAEDVLQTVFLRLSRREGAVNLEPSPASYMHRAAVNAALDVVRHRKRQESVPLDEMLDLAGHPQSRPDALYASGEIRRVVSEAVAGLGEKTSEMFVLRYFEGYDNHEIAEIMGTSQVVVGVLLHRARGRVKKYISRKLEGKNENN